MKRRRATNPNPNEPKQPPKIAWKQPQMPVMPKKPKKFGKPY